jgi:hypothetical protein
VGPQRATVRRRDTGGVFRFHVSGSRSLSRDDVEARLRDGTLDESKLVFFERASPQARELLRSAGIPYATPDGEVFLVLPELIVDLPAKPRRPDDTGAAFRASGEVSPFARRAARVPRWLLLHTNAEPTVTALAEETQLSRPFTSQVTHALADRALIELFTDPQDARSRRVRVTDPGTLADTWTEEWRRRRRRTLTWDIGTNSVDDTLTAWAEAARHTKLLWMLGGLAGARRVVRVAEAADVLVWIDATDVATWEEMLLAHRAPAGRAPLRVAAAPDPWVLGLASTTDGIPLADVAQLYLDCQSEGERALEAAAAIRRKVGW